MQFIGSVKRMLAFALALTLVFGLIPNVHATDNHAHQTVAASHGAAVIQRTQTRERKDVVFAPIGAGAALVDGVSYIIAAEDGAKAHALFDDGVEDEADPDSYKVTTYAADLAETSILNPSSGMLWTFSTEKGFISNAAWDTEHYLFGGIPAGSAEAGAYSLTASAPVEFSAGTIKFIGDTAYFLQYSNGALGVSTDNGTAFTIFSCAHANTVFDSVASTCTVSGKETVSCADCGAQISETALPLTEHSWDDGVTTTSPTCTQTGSKTQTCTACGATNVTEIVSLGHSFSPATCTLPSTCTRCTATSGSPLGHDFKLDESRSSEATCVSDGTEAYNCSRCDATDDKTIPATNHPNKEVNGIVEAGCTKDGYTGNLYCPDCDTILEYGEVIPKTGHRNTYTVGATAPTCTDVGATGATVCRDCNTTITESTTIPALGHDWADASCTAPKTCKRCEAKEGEPLGHSYSQVVTPPTCTTGGFTTHSCTRCGDTFTDAQTPATGHTKPEGGGTVTAPGCEEQGYTTYVCSVCGEPFTGDYTDPTGHNYGGWTNNNNGTHSRVCANNAEHIETQNCSYTDAVTDPTCTSGGYTRHTCSVCAYHYDDAATAATDHAWGDWTSNNDGTHSRVCSNDQTHIENKDCEYTSVTSAPTCTEKGYTTYTCSVCAYVEVKDYEDATGHSWSAWTSNSNGTHSRVCERDSKHTETEDCSYTNAVTDPTCTAGGYTRHTCSVCAYHYDDTETAATGHTKTEGSGITTAPTCEEQGYTTYVCSVCGLDYRDDYTDAIRHAWGAWTSDGSGKHSRVCGNDATHIEVENCDYATTVIPPSCTQEGKTTYSCRICEHTYDDNITEKLPHTMQKGEVVPPTCEEKGFTRYTCSVCGIPTKGDEVAATGHAWGDWTSNSNGTHSRVCSNDQTHIENKDCEYTSVTSAPTCTEKGYTTYTCSVCAYVEVKDYEDATGHSWSAWTNNGDGTHTHGCANDETHIETLYCSVFTDAVTAPTCSAKGFTTHTCKDCGYIKTDSYVEMLPHSPSGEGTVTAPTCISEGYTTYLCAVCGQSYKDSFTPIVTTNHNWQHDEARDTVPNCTETGLEAYTCTYCGDTNDRILKINPEAHSFAEDTERSYPPTCVADGLAAETCVRCKETNDSVIPMTPKVHDFVRDENRDTEPTCISTGLEAYSCSREGCAATNDTVLSVEPQNHEHVRVEGRDLTATCTATGIIGYDCALCHENIDVVTDIDSQNHDFVRDEDRDVVPNCKEVGNEAWSCSRCYVTNDKELAVDPLNHSLQRNPQADIPATCVSKGKTAYKCVRCDFTTYAETSDIDPNAHRFVKNEEESYPETCVADGLEVFYCANEGCTVKKNEVVPSDPKSHVMETTLVEPTCTKNGYTLNSCKYCDHSYQSDIKEALGHTYADATCTTPKTCTRCNETEGEALSHDYAVSVVEANCTEGGYTRHHCTRCDDEYRDGQVAALGHDFAPDAERSFAATCTEKGLDACSCSRCDATDDKEIQPLAHPNKEVRDAAAATCTEAGYTGDTYCLICGDIVEKGMDIPKTGHVSTHVEGAAAATCTEPGATGATICDACGETLTASTVIPALGHAPELMGAKEADCTENGFTGNEICSRCEEVLKEGQTIAALGHDWVEATCLEAKCCERCGISEGAPLGHDYESTVTEPDCTNEGYTTHCCLRCDDEYVDNKVPALGHSWSAATCTQAASCTRCGATSGEALNHDYKETVTAPTCTEKGYTTYHCSRCDDEYVGSYAEALNHPNKEVRGAIEAGCTTDGYTGNVFCPDCNKILEYGETIAQTGHKSTHIEGAKAATCTEPGATGVVVCDACKAALDDSEVIPALGHAPELIGKKTATCTEKGNTGNEICSRCAEVLKTGETIPALGHGWATATCTEPETCSRCSVTQGDPLGHSYVAVITEPGCTEDGFTTHSCTRCNESYTDTPTPAAGHAYADASCTAPKTCTRCGETSGEALGHDYPAAWSQYDETDHAKSCSRCDSVLYEAHSWDEGKANADDPAVTVYTCTVCSATRTETASELELVAAPAAKMLVYLEWEAEEGANGYEVLRKGENDENYEAIATVNATAYTDKGISASGTYMYMVKAYTLDGSGQKQYLASTQRVTVAVSARPEVAYGDVNCDTHITASDASAILRYLVSLQSLSAAGMANADCNIDALITAADAASILRYLVELEPALPVEN